MNFGNFMAKNLFGKHRTRDHLVNDMLENRRNQSGIEKKISKTANAYRQTVSIPAKFRKCVKMYQTSVHHTPHIFRKIQTHGFEDDSVKCWIRGSPPRRAFTGQMSSTSYENKHKWPCSHASKLISFEFWPEVMEIKLLECVRLRGVLPYQL